jgi:uncharacterized protein (TIGR00730 family)
VNVCVFCASAEGIDPSYVELARQVGQRLAAEGYGLVSGGGQVSMMGSVARAAREGGAHTVGVIPSHLLQYEVGDRDADELVIVETMRERKQIMDERSHAFVVLPGGIGTLEEFFEVWTSASLGMHAKPVVVLDPGGLYDPLWEYLNALRDKGFVRAPAFDALVVARTVDEAFAALPRVPAA